MSDARTKAKLRRRIARMAVSPEIAKAGPAFNPPPNSRGITIFDVETIAEAKRRGRGHRRRMATVGISGTMVTPEGRIAGAIRDALKVETAPGKCRSLENMSDEEIARLEAQYGCPIKRPGK